MNSAITKAADDFIEALLREPAVQTFCSAQSAMEKDTELTGLRNRYADLVQTFRQGQVDGTVTQEDISRLKTLQKAIEEHPVWIRSFEARADALALLQDCNRAISDLLGFDFGATAAPAAAC
jgi:cell fate (sporulation/competence/biofilm development) regulator YlbF (YheA/YmcA/DUF963 family)